MNRPDKETLRRVIHKMHILGIHERGHILIPIEEQLNLPELFYWTCYSWWNLLRIKRTGKQQSEDFTD